MDTAQTVSRRSFARLLGSGALALTGAAALGARPAAAGRTWCKLDPEFLVNGKLLHVYLSGSAELHDFATGPSEVTLHVPSQGVDAQFVWADAGFGGLGYAVAIVPVEWLVIDPLSGAIPVEVHACVPAKKRLEVQVEAVHEHKDGQKTTCDQKKSETNVSTRLKAKL